LTVIWFALLTLAVGGSLWFIRGNAAVPATATDHENVPVVRTNP